MFYEKKNLSAILLGCSCYSLYGYFFRIYAVHISSNFFILINASSEYRQLSEQRIQANKKALPCMFMWKNYLCSHRFAFVFALAIKLDDHISDSNYAQRWP